MALFSDKLNHYLESHTSPESSLLQNLNRETHLKVLMPQMLSGHLQGRVLSLISRMIRPHCILEIGTFTGYSALCLAEGLSEGGILHTIDVNEEIREMARRYFREAGLENKIKMHTGPAQEIIPQLNDTPDLVFIDADKANYALYYDLVMDKLRPGAFILVDNVLWSGKVLHPDQYTDAKTRLMLDFNNQVHTDPRVENTILPLRDGLMVIIKR